jgi:hypothetical protein
MQGGRRGKISTIIVMMRVTADDRAGSVRFHVKVVRGVAERRSETAQETETRRDNPLSYTLRFLFLLQLDSFYSALSLLLYYPIVPSPSHVRLFPQPALFSRLPRSLSGSGCVVLRAACCPLHLPNRTLSAFHVKTDHRNLEESSRLSLLPLSSSPLFYLHSASLYMFS